MMRRPARLVPSSTRTPTRPGLSRPPERTPPAAHTTPYRRSSMEISEKALRSLVRDVDEQHRDGMRTLRDDIADAHAVAVTSRRRVLAGAGIGGAALAGG